jgi:hypothetical protein
MANKIISNAIAIIFSNYSKRGLEKKYDKAFKSDLGKKLKELDKETRYVIEFVLYVLAAIADRYMSEASPIKKFFKEVLEDVAPELGKRLINGDGDCANIAGNFPGIQEMFDYLLKMDEEELLKIISSFRSAQGKEKSEILKKFFAKATENLKKTPEKEKADISEEKQNNFSEKKKSFLDKVNHEMELTKVFLERKLKEGNL